MKLTSALARLQRVGQPVLETGDIAMILDIGQAHASKIATRLAEDGLLLPLRRGVWALPGQLDPFGLPERLTAPRPAYVSLQSALYHHGMISQIPSVVYAVSLARTRTFTTPLGVVSIHHMSPDFFFGYETLGGRAIRMARAEKALLDVFYLTPARSRLFTQLPEVEKPGDFDEEEARRMIARIPFPARREMVNLRFERWLETASVSAM